MNILLKDVTIIDASSSFHLQTKDIAIQNGIIHKIENNIPSKGNPEIDCKNYYISNG